MSAAGALNKARRRRAYHNTCARQRQTLLGRWGTRRHVQDLPGVEQVTGHRVLRLEIAPTTKPIVDSPQRRRVAPRSARPDRRSRHRCRSPGGPRRTATRRSGMPTRCRSCSGAARCAPVYHSSPHLGTRRELARAYTILVWAGLRLRRGRVRHEREAVIHLAHRAKCPRGRQHLTRRRHAHRKESLSLVPHR